MERGLSLKELRLVLFEGSHKDPLVQLFFDLKHKHRHRSATSLAEEYHKVRSKYDVFLSYAHNESHLADYCVQRLQDASGSGLTVFQDKTKLHEGSAWLIKIAEALDSSRRVVALYSDSYWASINCKMEFTAAYARQIDSDCDVLFPIYLSETSIPYMFRSLQYADCRVNKD